MKRLLRAALALLLALALTAPVLALGPAESDVYYAQLSETAKVLYDELSKPENLQKLYTGDSIEIRFSLDGESFSDAANRIFSANSFAISALELNRPELFWLNASNDSISGNDSAVTLTVFPKFEPNWADGSRSVEDDAAAVDAAVKALAGEAKEQGGRYEQLLYVHDWLTQNNVYNVEAAASGGDEDYLPWTPLAALTDVSQPICEGYSKAFKLVCDELGIPCLLVDGQAGGGHMWNQVLLNGSWYAVDVTFDDPVISGVTGARSGYESHDYFLIGASTTADGEAFSESHIPDGVRVMGTFFSFPELSDTAFDPAAAPEPEEPEHMRFADVPEDAYFFPAVDWAVGIGVTTGTKIHDENGLNWFSPDDTVNRAQAVTFLWRRMGRPEPETKVNRFSDVPAGEYYEKAVLWAVENGITVGTVWDEANGVYKFSPTDPVTRGQMITFLWRSVGKPGETEPYEGKQWYSDSEYWAYEVGCLGDIAETYSTGADCPRCDVVYYLWQAALLAAG